MSEELSFDSAVNIAEGIRKKKYSSVEVATYFLNRINSLNSQTNSFTTITDELALETARNLDALTAEGKSMGPLHGVPVGIKDLGDAVKGIRSTFGSVPMKDFIAPETACYVQKLVDAGAIIVGKTNSPEFGHKGITDNYVSGATSTPFDLSRNAGGSSGGSAAAVAAGLVPIAQGSDGGGSVRIPAAWCGVYAIKPSFGRIAEIARPNAFALSSPFVGIGPISRTVDDSALMLSVMSGSNPRDPFSLPDSPIDLSVVPDIDLRGLRIAYTPDMGGFPVDNEVAEVVKKSLEHFTRAGAIVEEVKIKLPVSPLELSHLWVRLMALLYRDGFTGFKEIGYDLLGEHQSSLTPIFMKSLLAVNDQSALNSREDQRIRTKVYDAINDAFAGFDFLLSPTLAISPVKNLPNGETKVPTHINGVEIEPAIGWCLTFLINFTGHPAASVPCGFTESHLPVGLQIIGKRHADDKVLALSKAFEKISPWAQSYPRNS
jgi:amidase/aspartyl-tRNA(Asn)/glutamyl-tRNA(Gln) amidotransferase subunit A